MSRMQNFLKGLIKENPVLVLILGTCPTLAMTKSVFAALGLSLATAVVLLCSNIVISALRNIIPDKVRIPCYIIIIATFVTLVQMFIHAYFPDLYSTLAAFLELIVVNCIILGRAEMYASKNTVFNSILDALGMGLGFIGALVLMGSIREILGSGSWFGLSIPFLSDYTIGIFVDPMGGFLVYGCLIALINHFSRGKAIKKTEFSCIGCPSAGLCGKHTAVHCEKKEEGEV